MTMQRATSLPFVLFMIGLWLRLASLPFFGVVDMWSYFEWGARANHVGLPAAYTNVYFPFQWQLFQAYAHVAVWLGGDVAHYVAVFKAANLVFDLGTFLVVRRLLADWKASPAWALVFWCHPWFLAMSFLGYIDTQYAFVSLLSVLVADKARTWRGFAVAGIPLGLALLMKPQAEVLVLAAGLYAGIRWIRGEGLHAAAMLVAPSVLFVGYSLLFWFDGQPLTTLARSYLDVANVMPALTAQMLNLWHPLSYLLAPDGPIYQVPDTLAIVGPITIRAVAVCWTIGYLLLYPLVLSRPGRRLNLEHSWLLLYTHASLVLPMLMTNAHENHLYLASIFLVVLLPRVRTRLQASMIQIVLALQCLNVVGLYGLGGNGLSRALGWITGHWHGWPVMLAAVLGTVGFLVLMAFLFELAGTSERRSRSWWPSAVLLGLAGLVYLATLHRSSDWRFEADAAAASLSSQPAESARRAPGSMDRQ